MRHPRLRSRCFVKYIAVCALALSVVVSLWLLDRHLLRRREEANPFSEEVVSQLRRQIHEWTPADLELVPRDEESPARTLALCRVWKYGVQGLLWEPGILETATTPLAMTDMDHWGSVQAEMIATRIGRRACRDARGLPLVDEIKRCSSEAFGNIVVGMTAHPNPSLRYTLVVALSMTHDPETLRLLVDAVADEQDYVRDKAVKCLQEALDGVDGVPDAKETSPERMQASWRAWFESNIGALHWREGAFRVLSPQADDAEAKGDTR